MIDIFVEVGWEEGWLVEGSDGGRDGWVGEERGGRVGRGPRWIGA